MRSRNTAVIVAAIGTCLAVPSFADDTVTYKYDAQGRITAVTHTGTANGGVNAVYCYDHAGNRLRVSVGGVQGAAAAGVHCGASLFGTDFNGDGIDDILWRDSSGYLTNWLGTSSGGFNINDANAWNSVSTDWKIAGIGDFNGDGRNDILWRYQISGDVSEWLGTGNGGFIDNAANAYGYVPLSYKIVGTGDFNGDGRSDILWRASDGTITDWLGTPTGSFQLNNANTSNAAPNDWNVAGTGDVNGDGRSDIIWRKTNGDFSDWLGQPNGGFVSNGTIAGAQVATSWTITGVGDFNGDSFSDVLWRSNTGELLYWLGQPNGGFNGIGGNASYQIGLDWQVVATGDYNGDHRADILWRQPSTGALNVWLGQADGTLSDNSSNALSYPATNWYVQGPSTF